MSLDLSEKKENDKSKNNAKKELKWKELLYELFYEIKSETLGSKIEIEEEEYQENIRSITIPDLINYIHASIQILLKKKIDDIKEKQKEEDKIYYQDLYTKNSTTPLMMEEKNQYENIIRRLEAKERFLTKIKFMNSLQKEAMENKIGEYIEMEEEYEEMKTKLKYENGRFLNNDRKDNEILIIRSENSNLKKNIKKLEERIEFLEKDQEQKKEIINKLQEEIAQFKKQINEVQKDSHSINININNLSGTNSKSLVTNDINNMKSNIYNISRKNIDKNILFPYRKIKTKLINNQNRNEDILCTRNESIEKINSNLLNKYLIINKMNRNNIHLNNSCAKKKMNNFQISKNQKPNYVNNSSYHIPIFNRTNIKNVDIIKKIMSYHSIGNKGNISSRSNSKKVKIKNNKSISHRSLS